MKKILILALLFTLLSNSYAQKVKNVKLKTKTDSLSYAFGISIADNLEKQKTANLNPLAIGRAFQDFYNKEAKFSPEKSNKMIQIYFFEQNPDYEKYKPKIDEGKKFLRENGQKDSVVTLESGLQYKILKEGTGLSPKREDKVRVHYEGTLIDGTIFDSSYERGQPAEFGVTQVISGWTEVLQLMKEGSVWMVYLPYDLAYGDRPAGQIEPFSTLIFKIELLNVLK